MKLAVLLPVLAGCSFMLTAGPASKGHSWETCTAHDAHTRADLLLGTIAYGAATALAISRPDAETVYVALPLAAVGTAFILSGVNGRERVAACRAARHDAGVARRRSVPLQPGGGLVALRRPLVGSLFEQGE